MIELKTDDFKNTIRQIIKVTKELNDATVAYDAGHPIMTDAEWDEKYFWLKRAEDACYYWCEDSPTQIIHFEKVSKLEKVKHNHLMLSLDKTKDINAVKSFVGDKPWIAMAKMDGLTCSLKYEHGKLVGAETRGNGEVGENILHNAMVIDSIPKRLGVDIDLVVDGEIICTYQDFESFKKADPRDANGYMNPRNFAAGSIRLLDSKECVTRDLTFIAWDIITSSISNFKTLSQKLNWLVTRGFFPVPYYVNDENFSIEEAINGLKKDTQLLSYPIDGIVFKYNDCEYYQSLGATNHHFRGGLAYKFYDETYETTLRDIEWTMGRTGVLTPVAIFDPLDIEGSEVSRASLHNINTMKALGIREKNCTISIFKANMIIPQVSGVVEEFYGEKIEIPSICPICGGATKVIISDTGTEQLYCDNPNCQGKLINIIDHYCSKKGLDIKGLSKATLEKLIDWGWINKTSDIYTLNTFAADWKKKAGFGEKSVTKILDAIEASKNCELWQFISAIGIPEIGPNVAKILAKEFNDWASFRDAVEDDTYHFFTLDGFGEEMHNYIKTFDFTEADKCAHCLSFKTENNQENNNTMKDMIFVITGKLKHYKNRDALVGEIESHGGKVVGSISKKVNYLINNDINSNSAKNNAAKAANIPIISEEDFMNQFDL